jgi:predicted nuclease with RNAse H fold
MRYCGVVPMQGALQLVMLEEVRAPEPPIRLGALFFEPGTAAQVAAELRSLGELVVAVGAPLAEPLEGRPGRDCDALLLRLGVPPQPAAREVRKLADLLRGMDVFRPAAGAGHEGQVGEGAYHDAPVFETNPDGVFCALQGRRLPAKRHPLGMQMRIEELRGDHVLDDGGELWHRRSEEIDAAGCALSAHRYAVGHACWLGDPEEAVVVLPGSAVPDTLPTEGVLPPVERLQLPPVTE